MISSKTRRTLLCLSLIGLFLLVAPLMAFARQDDTATPDAEMTDTPEESGEAEATDEALAEDMEAETSEEMAATTGEAGYCLVCHDVAAPDAPSPDWSTLDATVSHAALAQTVHSTHTDEAGVGCLECHAVDIFPHVQAPISADSWESAAPIAEACESCHREGDEVVSGVCDTCHTDETMIVPDDPRQFVVGITECESCHATTIDEWKDSRHSEQQLACETCHIPHQDDQEMRFESVDALCLDCHDQDRDDYIHLHHAGQECADCHINRNVDTTLHALTAGRGTDTGHDNRVEPTSCIDCHENQDFQLTSEELMALEEGHPLAQAEAQIEALEKEIKAEREDGGKESSIHLIQGIILGLASGGILATLFRGYRRRHGLLRDKQNY